MNIHFTNHAESRIIKRKILKQEVIDAIHYPDKTIKKHGKYLYHKKLDRGIIEIVVEKTPQNLNVLTIYWL